MTEHANTAELARLDEVIAKNDASDGSNARWRAAHAVHKKAKLIERMDGGDAALALYADVIQRLEGCREPGPRELLIVAMNDVAVIHHKHGRDAQSRSAAKALVKAHFDDAPSEATDVVVNGTLLLARLLGEAGEYEQALELIERLIEHYAYPGAPNQQFTVAVANSEAAWVLGEAGRLEEGIRRCDAVIRSLGDPVDVALRSVLLDALVKQANLLSDNDLPEDRNAVCEEIVKRFAGSEDAEIAKNVTWAQMVLDEYPTRPRRRVRRWRRP
jgi:tetratricopeptide (TPR) repeat protein